MSDLTPPVEIHRKLYAMYQREFDRQLQSRTERAIDADYYDGHQFSFEERQMYENRGQPALVFNEIKPAILWLLGTERRNRNDWSVAPRTDDDTEKAIIKTKLLKYLDDINKARWQRSLAFGDAVKTGEGWTEAAVRRDDKGRIQLYLRYVHWREILCDSTCRDIDINENAKFLFRTRIIDLDELVANFPGKEAALRNGAQDSAELIDEDRYNFAQRTGNGVDRALSSGALNINTIRYGDERLAVRVFECWHKQSKRARVLDGDGPLAGQVFDQHVPAHQQAVASGEYDVVETSIKRMHLSIFTEDTLLWHGESPYRHNKFPYVRRLCEMDDTTGDPVGMIRAVRDPQTDLNHRRNKALYLLSTRRVIMDNNAVDDVRTLEEEVARPDSIIKVRPNSRLEIIENQSLAASELDIAGQDSAQIRQISGVTGENQGLPTNATSGIAIQARAEQGSVITTTVFDNATLAHQLEGEILLSLVEQFMTRTMQFRITGENNKPEFVTINDRPETDITSSQADFVVGQKDWRTTIRAGLSEQFMMLAQQLTGQPDLWMMAIELALELSDLPNRTEIMERFRKITGTPDPNEPEEQRMQREEAAQQQQAMQQQLAQKEAELKLAESAAKAAKSEADAAKSKADTEKTKAETLGTKLDVFVKALEGANILKGNSHLAGIADDLISTSQEVLKSPENTNDATQTQE